MDETSTRILATTGSGTSIFDPVLCELIYRWFCPPGGVIFNPFAGGSVRGIVASKLGRAYVGIDLADGQLTANRMQAKEICDESMPEWRHGDSRELLKIAGVSRRTLYSHARPTNSLEIYSEDPRDLSTMACREFRAAYEQIIADACKLLKHDRFACFVVGDVRDKHGCYRGLPWHTVEAFEKAGLLLYNEAVLVTAAGSLPLRVGRQFDISRKLDKTHQNVLVFVKGDPKKATIATGAVEFGDI
jgi:hypothetical protein